MSTQMSKRMRMHGVHTQIEIAEGEEEVKEGKLKADEALILKGEEVEPKDCRSLGYQPNCFTC